MSARDPIEVLRERAAGLEEQLRELEGRRREQSELEGRAAQVKGALQDSLALLDRVDGGEARRRALPMLGAVRVAAPCSARWEEMVGDDTSRFCGKCEKNVYNLSAMTREEAEVLLRAKEGDLCVRMYQRADGTILTQDCPVGVRRKRLRLIGALALGSSFAGAAAAFGLALEGDCEPPPTSLEVSLVPAPIAPPSARPAPPQPPTPGSPTDPEGPFWTMGALSGPAAGGLDPRLQRNGPIPNGQPPTGTPTPPR